MHWDSPNFSLLLHFKAIPYAPDRLDILRLGRVELDLLPDLLDVHRHRGDVPQRLHVPDLVKQLLLREHVVRVLRQERKKVKFLRREVLLLPIHVHPPGGLVDLESADLYDLILRHPAADEALVPGEVRLHTRHHLAGAERLRDVVVGAQAQAADLVDVVLLRGDHDDGRILGLADLFADLKSIHPLKHQIQDLSLIHI